MKNYKFIWKYIKNYKFNSILVKNMLTLLLLELIPVSVALYLGYVSYTKLYESEVLRQNEIELSEVMTLTDQIFYDTGKQLASMSLSQDIELFMYADPSDEMIWYNVRNIQQLQKMQILGTPYIKNVYIYANKSQQVIQHTAIVSIEKFRDRECIDEYLELRDELKTPKILTSLDYNVVFPYVPEMRLALYYDIYFGDGQKGVAIASIDPVELKKKIEAGKDCKFYIIDRDTILYASQTEYIGMSTEELKKLLPTLQEGVYVSGETQYAVRKSGNSELLYVSIFPEMVYPEEVEIYANSLKVLLIILILLSIMLCVYVSVKMFKPLESILLKLGDENLFHRANDHEISGMNELKYIVNAIENSKKDKAIIETELENRIRMLKKAQSVALQSQINPHFINNTLQTVNSLAMLKLGAVNEVSAVAKALSGMLRISLENTDNIITVQQEMEHCMLYLEIQERRYSDKFDVEWNIPNEIQQCKTIKIILQPIVENCIYHGIKPMSDRGLIKIDGRMDDESIYFFVQDNGLGMDANKLAEIHGILASETIKESSHLGIANVNQRIKLYFGEEYGIHISSDEWVGTTVTIRIPKIE